MWTIKPYTKDRIPDVLAFEQQLRQEEDVWGWKIDDAYIHSVQSSFDDPRFQDSVSLLAYNEKGSIVGRIDSTMIPSHFDGSVKAYLDWICVLKSARHQGVAQALMEALRKRLKSEGIDTLIGLTAANEEAQRFYSHLPDSMMRDIGIWINVK